MSLCVSTVLFVFSYVTCDMSLSDLQVLKIGDLDLQLDLGRPSRVEPSQASNAGSPQKRPKPCG